MLELCQLILSDNLAEFCVLSCSSSPQSTVMSSHLASQFIPFTFALLEKNLCLDQLSRYFTQFNRCIYTGVVDSGLCTLARHCHCLPGALGFYISSGQRSPRASIVALLLLLGVVQLNPRLATHIAC